MANLARAYEKCPKDVLLAAMIMLGSCHDNAVIGHDAHGHVDVARLLAELIRGWKKGMTRDIGRKWGPEQWPPHRSSRSRQGHAIFPFR
jgi:hypothetical protein